MNLSIVIPNYNGEETLKKNLPKVIKEMDDYKGGKIEIIIVDDSSEDNSADIIRKFSRVKLLSNSQNKGFSSTVDKGVAAAKGELIVLLNVDVYPEPGFMKPILLHFKNPNLFAVGCMDKSVEGDGVVLRGRGLGSWQRGFFVHQRGEVDKTDTMWVSGGSGIFRKSIWDELGGLNRLFDPFYWEDIDLSYRAQKAGYSVLFEPKSIVWHEHEKGIIKRKYTREQVNRIVYRNQFFFVWTNLTDSNLLISHVIWLPYHLIKALFRLDSAFFLGFLKALALFPKALQSRNLNKKTFKKKDIEITQRYVK